jgi:hypothetical protein
MKEFYDKELLRKCANMWLGTPNKSWNEIMSDLHIDSRGHDIARACRTNGFLPKVTNGKAFCSCCKKVRVLKSFNNPDKAAFKVCNFCKKKAPKDGNLSEGYFDAATKRGMQIWDAQTRAILRTDSGKRCLAHMSSHQINKRFAYVI